MSTYEEQRKAIRAGDFELALELERRLGLKPGAEHRGRLSPLEARRFVLAGNAVFTVVNLEPAPASTSRRRTFRVRFYERTQVYYVDALWGSDNTRDYEPLGTLTKLNDQLPQAREFKLLRDHLALARPLDVPSLPRGWAVYQEGRCGRCARRLTVPESINSGIGPDCRALMVEEGTWTAPGSLLSADPPPPPVPADKPWLKGIFDE